MRIYTQRFHFKRVFLAVGIIFTIVGLVFLGVAVGTFFSSQKFYEHAVSAEGEISKISRDQVYVSYEAEGEEFDSRLGFYSSAMRVGDPITVYYHPEDPSVIRTKSSRMISWIFGGVGAAVLITGIILIVASFRKKSRENQLKKTGMRLDARIVGIAVDPRLSSNYQHPYILQCQYEGPGGRVYLFKSGPIWYDPTNLLTDDHVPVYVERENYDRYYVDISQVLPK